MNPYTNKELFLRELERRLEGIPDTDRQASLVYYTEMLDDMIEDGVSEAEAVASLGSVDAIAEQILLDMPLTKLVKARVKPKRPLRGWQIALIALGSPVWFPILLAMAVVLLAVYVVIWSVVLCLYAADLCLAVGFIAGVAGSVLLFITARPGVALMLLGAGLICAGLAVFAFLGCNAAAKGAWKLGRLILRGIKSCFVRKEGRA
jgi:uncharacterized membrane protein